MPGGRFWYGPGFWKGAGWHPGAGGFQGGWSGYGPRLGGRGFYRWWSGAQVPYYAPVRFSREEEKSCLEEQLELLKSELAGMEQRLAELNET